MFNTSCLVIKFNQDVNRFKLARKQMQANCFIDSLFSDINNSISAPALGAGGRGFESRYPDNIKRTVTWIHVAVFFVITFSDSILLSGQYIPGYIRVGSVQLSCFLFDTFGLEI